MKTESPAAASLDARTKRQVSQLMAQMARLMEFAMASHEHPCPDLALSMREVKANILLGEKGEMIMTDLAAALDSPLSTVTRVVDRLEKKGLIVRSRSQQDRRIVVVRGSAQGRELHESARKHQLAIAWKMLQPLTNGEREMLIELMAKLTRGLDKSA